MTRETLAARIAKAIAIAWILAWSLGPIVIGFVTSISGQTDVRAVPARWVPHTLTLDSYRQLLGGTTTRQNACQRRQPSTSAASSGPRSISRTWL